MIVKNITESRTSEKIATDFLSAAFLSSCACVVAETGEVGVAGGRVNRYAAFEMRNPRKKRV